MVFCVFLVCPGKFQGSILEHVTIFCFHSFPIYLLHISKYLEPHVSKRMLFYRMSLKYNLWACLCRHECFTLRQIYGSCVLKREGQRIKCNSVHNNVSQTCFYPLTLFWLWKITTDPNILAQVNIGWPGDRYLKLKFYVSEAITHTSC
jgi:hypothetical protein